MTGLPAETSPSGPPGGPGLTGAEVAARRAAGRHNELPAIASRRVRDIVRANVLTRFTAIIVVLAVVVLAVGRPADAIFAGVLVCNIAIGVVQEVRAKRTLDRLVDLLAPTVAVRRDGTVLRLGAGELVIDDVVELEAGDQVPVDAVVLDSRGLELDESSLTGESEPVPKAAGDEVLSGSAVVAGSATVVAVRVGRDARIHGLVAEAGRFGLARSELRVGVDRLLRVISWGLPPLAGLLLWSQLRANASVRDGLVAVVAGLIGLVPQGLVLLVSLALAVAVGRLARRHVVIQELFAVECLARVDVLCVDKTGTLTTGAFRLEAVEALPGLAAPLGKAGRSPGSPDGPAWGEPELRAVVAALVAADPSPNATMAVLGRELGPVPARPVTVQVPFSSARKWSGATFGSGGSWLLGAPEVLLDAVAPAERTAVGARVDAAADAGRRVLLVAHSPEGLAGEELPAGLTPAGLIELSEELRDDAAATMAYFARQRVAVKVISGDNPRTVSAVAARVGLPGAEHHADLRGVDGGTQLDGLAVGTTVFGRVLPEQKRDLVAALQRAGHVVAMTGDGVNDIPALKQADIGIAMDTATPATRAVARLVLLDGRFDHLPDVVAEGRRVIANMERVSALFLTKTVYSAIFAVVVALSGAVYPYLPRQMSLVSELTVGIPAFVLSFRAVDRPVAPGYVGRVLRFALPSGVAAALVVLASDRLNRGRLGDPTGAEARTVATIALLLVSLWIVYRLVQPVDRTEGLLLGALVAMFAVVLSVPPARALYGLELPAADVAAAATATTIGCIAVLEVVLRGVQRVLARHPAVGVSPGRVLRSWGTARSWPSRRRRRAGPRR